MSAHIFSFYVPGLQPSDTSVLLTGDEHNHLSRVLRMGAGDTVHVTNGRGLIVSAQIERVGKTQTTGRVTAVEASIPEPVPLVLSVGLLPREAMTTALTQCTEAGITAWMPVVAQRCHVRRVSDQGERWSRVAVAALKQSGRAWLPRIEKPVDIDTLIARFAGFDRVVVAEAAGTDVLAVSAPAASTLGIIGPEGGFTEVELARLTGAGAVPVRLSAQRLRAETASVVLASALARSRGAV